MIEYLSYSEEIAYAMAQRLPVVALETAVFAHSLPYPRNVEMAEQLAADIRKHGAVPAFIGFLQGRIKLGLHADEWELLADQHPKRQVAKVGRGDVAAVLAAGKTGAATFAAALYAAQLAGIKVAATGGIGGVHREGEPIWTVSADMPEPGRAPIAVICGGCPSVLDIRKMLTYCRTDGISVVGYQIEECPTYYSPNSGYRLERRLDDVEAIARMLQDNSTVIVHGMGPEIRVEQLQMEDIIASAIAEAKRRGFYGQGVTPFLFARVEEFAKERSVDAHLAMMANNAGVAAAVARASLSQT